MRETKYNKLHGHKLLVAQRRAELTKMMMEQPDRKWSVRDMADEAQKRDWFKANQPTYSKSTAHKDYVAVIEDLKEYREELASYYIENHLNTTDAMLEELETDLDEIEKEYEFSVRMIDLLEDKLSSTNDSDLVSDIINQIQKFSETKSKIRKERRDIQNSMLSVMRRQSTLVPIQVPFEQKGVNVQVNNVQLTIDDFQKEKARIKQQSYLTIPESIISDEELEGDFEIIDSD